MATHPCRPPAALRPPNALRRGQPPRLCRPPPQALDDDEDQEWQWWDEPTGVPPPEWEDFEPACPEAEPQPDDRDFWHDDLDDDQHPEAWR